MIQDIGFPAFGQGPNYKHEYIYRYITYTNPNPNSCWTVFIMYTILYSIIQHNIVINTCVFAHVEVFTVMCMCMCMYICTSIDQYSVYRKRMHVQVHVQGIKYSLVYGKSLYMYVYGIHRQCISKQQNNYQFNNKSIIYDVAHRYVIKFGSVCWALDLRLNRVESSSRSVHSIDIDG